MSKRSNPNAKQNSYKSGRSKGRGSRPKSKEKNMDQEITEQKEGKGSPIINNAAMYFTDMELAEMVTNISFNQFIGSDRGNFEEYPELDVPNIMKYFVNPCPGWLDGNVSEGINAVALKTYTILSASNAKTTNYGPQDISTLILAFGEVLSFTEHLRRILGVAYLYNVRNRFVPRGVMKALGVESTDLTKNLATYRIRFNTIINRINTIPVMKNIEYLNKCYELYRHIYTDSESPMAQYYVMLPYSTWILNEAGSQQGSTLETVLLFDTVERNLKPLFTTYDKLLDQLDAMINTLLTSSTFNYIYADVLRLGVETWTVELCSEGYACMPEYNPMIALQLQNAIAIGAPVNDPDDYAYILQEGESPNYYTASNNVIPNVNQNSLEYRPLFVWSSDAVGRPRILNFPHSEGHPDIDQRCDATRYMAISKLENAAEGYFFYNGDGNQASAKDVMVLADHYITHIKVESYAGDTLASEFVAPEGNTYISYGEGVATWPLPLQMAKISNFSYAPIFYIDVNSGSMVPGVTHIRALFCELDYFTEIDMNYLLPVDDLALQGLFTLRVPDSTARS
jgi:hypothetical protein